VNNTMVSVDTADVYASATGTLALEVGKHEGVFDRVRLALMGTVGRMPLIENGGVESGAGTYFALGMSASIGLGLGEGGKPD
jgi:hypothetical protein